MNLNKSHIKFWGGIPILILIGLFYNNTFDLNVHDTYIVINTMVIAIYCSIFLFISGLGYFFFKKNELNRILEKAHIRMTVIGLLSALCLFIINSNLDFRYTGDYESMQMTNNISFLLVIGQIVGLATVILGFVLYLINIFITLIKTANKG